MSSTYINGYVKDQPLRSMEQSEVLNEFVKFNESMGRSALKHNTPKVISSKKSIQGEWADNMWENYPKHLLETQREMPYAMIEQP